MGSPLSSQAVRLRQGAGDLAAGPRRRNSLSEVELLPWLCCMAPALSLLGIYGIIIVTAFFFSQSFYVITAVLTFFTMAWISNMACSSLLGAYKLRQGSLVDWHSKLEQIQAEDGANNDFNHIVLLPNYKENEVMMGETLDNLGRSPLASTRMRVVLAMEAREGPAGREKAERLMKKKAPLFADIFATFHPSDIDGEIAGKSSNTQWAYREALRHFGLILMGSDQTKVFLTVGDADTLWHPQYFSALTYNALTSSPEARSWRIWQPPILLLRNVFTVPCMTRASAHATLIFELSQLANQYFFPALAYSSYSLTVALASHPEVDGWDPDVIAEDHHMFCKCYFAALWELAHLADNVSKTKGSGQANPIAPRLRIEPIFLPAVSYLVDTDGYVSSCWARFQQARRHCQGVVELGYVLLQYTRLMRHTGVFKLPWRTHLHICSIAVKMHTLHITATAQSFALVLAATISILPAAVSWAASGGLLTFLQQGVGVASQISTGFGALDVAQQALAASFGNISIVAMFYSATSFIVVLDLIEGRYYTEVGRPSPMRRMHSVKEDDEKSPGSGSEDGIDISGPKSYVETLPFVEGKKTWSERFMLFNSVMADTSLVGYPALIFYAVIPEMLAAYSLLRRGTDFEYVVAEKPEE